MFCGDDSPYVSIRLYSFNISPSESILEFIIPVAFITTYLLSSETFSNEYLISIFATACILSIPERVIVVNPNGDLKISSGV